MEPSLKHPPMKLGKNDQRVVAQADKPTREGLSINNGINILKIKIAISYYQETPL